jgi:choline dehydrogenase-like flavoprotein
MLPLTAADAATLHPARLPANLYVADATLLPHSLGNPPILTILALAKRVARVARAAGDERSRMAKELRIDGKAAIRYSETGRKRAS